MCTSTAPLRVVWAWVVSASRERLLTVITFRGCRVPERPLNLHGADVQAKLSARLPDAWGVRSPRRGLLHSTPCSSPSREFLDFLFSITPVWAIWGHMDISRSTCSMFFHVRTSIIYYSYDVHIQYIVIYIYVCVCFTLYITNEFALMPDGEPKPFRKGVRRGTPEPVPSASPPRSLSGALGGRFTRMEQVER